MKFANPLGIEYRVVSNAQHEGQDVRVVSGARTFDANIEELWDAITRADRIARWFAPVSGKLELGGRYQIEGNAGGTITRCDEPNALDVTWEYYDNVSWVTVRLEPHGPGTKLTLAHLMGKDAASEEHWKKYGPGATGVGWELGFLNLGVYLARGEAITESDSNEWSASNDGKAFIRACAAEWGESHVRAGADRATAEAMATETADFYCGGPHQHQE